MTRLFGACGAYLEFIKKKDRVMSALCIGGIKEPLSHLIFTICMCKLHLNLQIAMTVMSIYVTLVDIWPIFCKAHSEFPSHSLL